jgi:hypothetical protein
MTPISFAEAKHLLVRNPSAVVLVFDGGTVDRMTFNPITFIYSFEFLGEYSSSLKTEDCYVVDLTDTQPFNALL